MRIALSEPYEVRYWSRKFKVTPARLKTAVAAVGHSSKKVGTYFAARKTAKPPRKSTVANNRLKTASRYRLRFGGFGHPKGEDDQGHEGGGASGEKGRAVAEMIDDLAGGQPAQRGADPLHRGDGALGQVVAAGAAHDIGDHQGRERAENPGADAIEHLDADQPEAVVGKGVEHRADRQDGEPGEKQAASVPKLSAVRPTRSAIGSITACAATMQADIMAVASFGYAAASFCPTSGSNGALAKWNSMTHRPKMTSGRDLNRMP